ncbi:GAF domain-containing sensor histidine kinase [Dictyobacter kobayashii]|uniref:Circadian input-output histidine kinase CikA n=1 Tax=Dictyobacter kobayashii TaxID=2014872 RepID=A0A402AK34_9CHLR|nr:ATP-binding protein [Dictyobacter kobayashii]GCE19419.1 hypothetical protein KDK_32190 [Dictyobacter kobayashii]
MTLPVTSSHDHEFFQNVPSFDVSVPDVVSALRKVVQNVNALFSPAHCIVALVHPSHTTLLTYTSDHTAIQHPFNYPDSLPAQVMLQRQPMAIADAEQDSRAHELPGFFGRSLLIVPLIYDDICIGTLAIARAEPGTFDEQAVRILSAFADQAALSLVSIQQASTNQRIAGQLERTILQASSDGIAILGKQRRFIEANPAFSRMFALDAAQLVERQCAEVFGCTAEVKPACCLKGCMIEHALHHEQSLDYAEVDITVQGSSRLLGLSVTPVALQDAPVCLVIARDMTAVRDATRSRAKFLSMITHELRSPLNAINGYLELLLAEAGGELTSEQREFAQRARAGSENLYALLEDLLLISRADAGQMRLNRELIHLSEVIENAVEELELTALDNGIQIHLNISPQLPRLYADAVRLQQVLRNLINNALHFTPEGGEVVVSAALAEVENGLSASQQPDDEPHPMLQLQVQDTGCGIAPEFQQRIFERFFQAPNEGIGRAGGQGLGLAIVKMIVELHDGTVTVASTPGQGSTFTCLLPCLLN